MVCNFKQNNLIKKALLLYFKYIKISILSKKKKKIQNKKLIFII